MYHGDAPRGELPQGEGLLDHVTPPSQDPAPPEWTRETYAAAVQEMTGAPWTQMPAPPPGPSRRQKFRAMLGDVFSTHLGKSTGRIRLVAGLFGCLYLLIAGRLVYFGLKPEQQTVRRDASEAVAASRPDLVDRNGEILAQDVKVMSIFAEPRRIIDKDEATELITAVLPDLNARELREKLGGRKGFIWIKREVTPAQQQAVFRLGLPGIGNSRLVLSPDLDAVFETRGPLERQVRAGFSPPKAQGAAGRRQSSARVVEEIVGFKVRRAAPLAARLPEHLARPAQLRGRELDLDLLATRWDRGLLAFHGRSRRAISCARFPSTRPL